MYHLVYTSYGSQPFSESDLIQLLNQSNTWNKTKEITGMLLYLQGKFIQVLEGDKSEVKKLYEKIANDTRHKKVTIVIEGDYPERLFKDWSMGFKQITDDEFKTLSGFQDIDAFFEKQQSLEGKNLILIFLQLFYRKNNTDYPEPAPY